METQQILARHLTTAAYALTITACLKCVLDVATILLALSGPVRLIAGSQNLLERFVHLSIHLCRCWRLLWSTCSSVWRRPA